MLQEQHPSTRPTDAADEGTLAASIAAHRLMDNEPTGDTTLSREMLDAVDLYVRAVRAVAGDHRVHVEEPVKIPSVHPECNGTPDAWWFDSTTSTLHLWDFKYGWGLVDPFRNWQLILYALGVPVQFASARLYIVQPRPYHLDGPARYWDVGVQELQFLAQHAQTSALSALSDTPRTESGPHCRYCSALYACETARRSALTAIDVAGEALAPACTPERLGFELHLLRRASEAINHRLAAVEQIAMAMGQIPGWTIKHTAGRMEWDNSRETEIRNMAAMLGVQVDKPGLITPTQAVKAGLPTGVVNMYSSKKAGKAQLEPINNTKIQQLLGGA